MSGSASWSETVLVSGGAVGGAAIARLYAAKGVRVVIADINEAKGNALALELNQDRPKSAIYEPVDVTDPQSVAGLMARLATQVDGLNHMISVAGGAALPEWRGLAQCALEDIEQTTRLNLLSHQYLLRFAKPLLVAAAGHNRSVVFVGSINALRSFDLPSYSAAKAGIQGLMFGAAREFTQSHGIRINMVVPGTMHSARTAQQPKDEAVLLHHALLKSLPTHSEIAEAIYSFTHRLPHCTQQSLVIDAGQTAYGPPHNTLYG